MRKLAGRILLKQIHHDATSGLLLTEGLDYRCSLWDVRDSGVGAICPSMPAATIFIVRKLPHWSHKRKPFSDCPPSGARLQARSSSYALHNVLLPRKSGDCGHIRHSFRRWTCRLSTMTLPWPIILILQTLLQGRIRGSLDGSRNSHQRPFDGLQNDLSAHLRGTIPLS